MGKVYLHIDLNAFFASAEVILNPSLAGKPIAVSGNTRRSVISTASYEARKKGIHSAQPVQEAIKMCPELIVVPGHYSYYLDLSKQFINIIKQYTSLVEQASIDECYADVTEVIFNFKHPLDLAWEIQQRVLKEIGLRCSIGIAPNMFLAKMASDMKKPMGITILRIRDVPKKLWPLHIEEMRGIGKKTLPYMKQLNIQTIGDLANYPDISRLKPIFGKNTDIMLERAHGIDKRELIVESDSKSMGISETTLEDITDYDEIRGLFRTLSRKLSARLKEAHKAGSHLSIRICYYDFRNVDRSKKIDHPIWSSEDIFSNAISLFEENWEEGEAIRLIGISLSDFASDTLLAKQINLFDSIIAERQETKEVLADLNKMIGSRCFVRASTLLKKDTNETNRSTK